MTLFAYANATYTESPRESTKQFLQLTNELTKSVDIGLIHKTQLFKKKTHTKKPQKFPYTIKAKS